MKLKNKILAFVAPTAIVVTTMPIALTSCGGGNTPTGDRTNKIIYPGGPHIIAAETKSISIEMTLEKELASGQIIKGLVTSADLRTGGTFPGVKSVTVSGKTATVNIEYLTAPKTDMAVDTLAITFTGSTNGTTEWSNKVEGVKITCSKS